MYVIKPAGVAVDDRTQVVHGLSLVRCAINKHCTVPFTDMRARALYSTSKCLSLQLNRFLEPRVTRNELFTIHAKLYHTTVLFDVTDIA